jgi:preprotein translocase subunit SecA
MKHVYKYDRSDDENQKKFLEKELKPGRIILATNLAGRGTDFKLTKETEQNGGLHSLFTYFPRNTRVLKQVNIKFNLKQKKI